MEVLIEKKMIDIKSEPVELVVEKPRMRRESTATPTELEPCEEFPILYGLLTAPKSFKPKNSEELQFLPLLRGQEEQGREEEGDSKEKNRVMVTSRVQLVQCRRKSRSSVRRSRSRSLESEDQEEDIEGIEMEEADSQNLDFCSSRSSSSSPQTVDSSSNMSGADENNSPIFLNYLSRSNSNDRRSENSQNRGDGEEGEEEEEEIEYSHHHPHPSRVSSPGGGSTYSEESNLDDNIPTSTTSGFRRKACRLEHAIGNIVKRRRVPKRPTSNNSDTSSTSFSSSSSSSSSVPISMAPSSPTVSTTCVDPPSQQQQQSRGRSEILERILRSNTTTTNTNQRSADSQSPSGRQPLNEQQGHRGNNDDNNNNESGRQHEPFAKLRDLLTMPEDQLVKRRRMEYGISENKVEQDGVPMRRREFSPPRNNILASLLQKGRAPYDPVSSYNNHSLQRNAPPSHHHNHFLSPSINKIGDNHSNSRNTDQERPYKCSLCDLRFKKLPLLNRHVKTHSHIKRYVCRFCSHGFKRSDNLLAHMRTSCKGIKEQDTKLATGGGSQRALPPMSNSNITPGQIIPQLLSAPPAGPLSPMVSRSQLEEALLNLNEKRYANLPASSPLVSTTTGSPPPPPKTPSHRRQIIQPDFQSKHSKLLEILSGSPVVQNNSPHFRMEDEQEEPLPLSLKIERRSPTPICSSSLPSPNQSQFRRSHQNHHHQQRYLGHPRELPHSPEEGQEDYEEVLYQEEEENDNDQPLDLGRHNHHHRQPVSVPPQQPSARSRDHPEIVSILSRPIRQPKNVMMLGPDLRKLVGIDAL